METYFEREPRIENEISRARGRKKPDDDETDSETDFRERGIPERIIEITCAAVHAH